MTSATDLTRQYDRWLASRIPVVEADVARKHEEMRADRFRFLRGTYYLWLARVAERVPDVLDAARVPLVGDLHVENFGTWRDRDQTRRWGVNDYDELAVGPWLLDPLRLAVSARLAPHVALGEDVELDTLLSSYAEAEAGAAIKLEGKRGEHLVDLVPAFAHERKFYQHLEEGAPADDVPAEVVAAATSVAEPGWKPRWFEHEAGTGSLGHLRRVGVGPADDGGTHAREAKELGPGSAVWAAPIDRRMPTADAGLFVRVMAQVKGPAAVVRVSDWHVRDLAPDVVRIELSGLHKGDARRLLGSMAEVTAAVHATDTAAYGRARKEAAALDPATFQQYVDAMVDVVRADHASYR
ncbi:MAG: DUF2252 domain-containing protein [Nocardioidaceae bacterium]|nr:DUF2252 domain-containing protein [Nocardioidaceae bacterium]